MVIDFKTKTDKDKNLPTIILGVDSSSTGIAWTLLENGTMTEQGKIVLSEKTINQKLKKIELHWRQLVQMYSPDAVYLEQSIFVKSPGTFRTLSFVVGSLMCITESVGVPVILVEPATWKAFYKYKNLSRVFVDTAKKKIGISEANKLCDRLRKSQTWRVVQHNFPDEAIGSKAETDHDIADSWAIGLYGYSQECGPIALEISDSIRIDQEELARLGLKL
jgi:hypothetical protein